MRTSKAVYHQILWDERLDPVFFVLHIDMHASKPKELRFTAFDPNGDLPWHRVLAFACDGTICWDREGTDTLDALANTGRFVPRTLLPPYWEARTAVRFDGSTWVSHTGQGETRERIRLLTWNVLWDRFDADLLRSGERWPRLIEQALDSSADLIAFQEVTPTFHRLVLEHPEVRRRFWVSHPAGHPDIGSADLLFIGCIPLVELAYCRLRPHKAALGVVLGAGPLVLCTHLSSDHSHQAAHRREEELQCMQRASDLPVGSIWMGDFNLAIEEPLLDTRDAWTALHPPEPTFDPVRNPLAVHSSRSGKAVRIDRVLLRGAYQAVSAERIGLEAEEGLHPSDHYGLRVDIDQNGDGVFLGAPSRRSALAFVPTDPADLEAIRSERDPAYQRWPPHLNLLWPFVPESELDAALEVLQDLRYSPFEAGLSRRRRYSGQRTTQYLGPRDPAPWNRLIRQLKTRFPTCGSTEPHLTLARDEQALPTVAVEQVVGELVLLTRRGEGRFEPRARWAYDGAVTDVQSPIPFTPATPFAHALPKEAVLVGSRRLGVALEGADVDLLWAAPIEGVRKAVSDWGSIREVERAGLPGLVVQGSVRVDIVVLPVGATVETRLEQPEPVCNALTAASDADALLECDHVELFREVLRWVKAWARAQDLDQAALGGLEGLAWAVMVRRALIPAGPRAAVLAFFAHWAGWDWDRGVGCEASAPVSIGTPTNPVRVITTRARRAPLERALWQAWVRLEEGACLEELLIPPLWHRAHREAVRVLGASAEAEGWAMGRARALIEVLGEVAPRRVPGGFVLGLSREVDPVEVDRVLWEWATHEEVEAQRVYTWEVV